MYQLPVADKSKLFRKTFYLPAASLAHLPEKHYHKISRHPGCSKYTVDIPDVVHWIRKAYKTVPQPVSGSLNNKRYLDTGTVLGYTKEGTPTTFVTVITSLCGEVKAAFPGPYLL